MSQYTGLTYSDTNSSTLAGITQDIYFLGKCNAQSISPGDLNRIINKYYAILQNVIKGVNESFYMVQATADLVIGTGTYTYPDGTGTAPAYEKLKSIWGAFNPANSASPLSTEYQRVNCVDADAISDPAYSFTKPTAMLFGSYFILLPLVTDTTIYPVTNGVKVYYIATQQTLTLATDVPVIFPGFHGLITQGSLIDVAQRLGNTELKKDAEETWAQGLKDIASYASNHLPLEIGVVEGQDGEGGWMYPFGNNSMS